MTNDPQLPASGHYTIAVPNIEEFQLRNEFEEDVFLHMPRIAEAIYLGKDVTCSIDSLAREMGLGRTRFQKIYDAVKLEHTARLDIRSGSDLRQTYMFDLETEIARVKQRMEHIETQRTEGMRKLALQEDPSVDKTLPANQPTREELIHAAMPAQAYYKILIALDNQHQKWVAQRNQLSGIMVQRKEIIHGDAKKLMEELYNNEEMQTRLQDMEYQNQQLKEQLSRLGATPTTVEPQSLINLHVNNLTPKS